MPRTRAGLAAIAKEKRNLTLKFASVFGLPVLPTVLMVCLFLYSEGADGRSSASCGAVVGLHGAGRHPDASGGVAGPRPGTHQSLDHLSSGWRGKRLGEGQVDRDLRSVVEKVNLAQRLMASRRFPDDILAQLGIAVDVAADIEERSKFLEVPQ